MSQRDEKARKRARKKAEEAKRQRERAAQKPAAPQRILTDYARAIVQNFPEGSSKRQQLEMNFHLFHLRVQRLPAHEAWQEALALIDQAMRSASEPISCQRGCSACCHQHVGLSAVEAALIQDYLEKEPIPLDAAHLEKQRQARQWNDLSFAERRCVFLGSEGECRIYPVRPLTCRRYFVTSDPIHCQNEAKGRIQSTLHAECDAYLSAFLTRYGVMDLPDVVANLKTES